jgi:hypothetical protein
MKPVLTHSAISTFDCPMKFKLRQVDRLRPRIKREGLAVGGLYHIGRELGEDVMLDRLDEYLPLDQYDADKQMINRAILLGMLRAAESWFDNPAEMEHEPEWLLPIINPDTGRQSKKFLTGGKADGIGWDGLIWCVIEEKTTAQRWSKSDIDKLPLDRQVLNEVSNLQRARNITVSQVRYRYILKPYIKQKQTESTRQYCDRVMEDYAERPEFYLHEERLYVEQERVIEWERDLWRLAQVIDHTQKHNAWYRNTSRCAEWGGCSYLPICRGEDIEGMYVNEVPNPELKEVAHVDFTTGEEVGTAIED